jgi:outer membrane immunogenic protein
MISKFSVAMLATALAVSSTAYAADLPVKAPMVAPVAPAPSWTGFYLGLNAGGAWGLTSTQSWVMSPNIAGNDPINFNKASGYGAVGGFQGGYNWQIAPVWVIGAEGDFSWTSQGNSNSKIISTAGVPLPANTVNMSKTPQWFASARAKLGYSWGSTMLYATGGAAWEKVGFNALTTYADGSHSPTGQINDTKSGWVAGGGVEWMATPHVLLRAEYLYYGIDTAQSVLVPCMTAPGACAGVGGSLFTWGNSNIQVVRAALSYKF